MLMRLAGCVLLFAAVLGLDAGAGEPVRIEHRGIGLNGALAIPPEGALANGVVLITHGTLAHHGMEIVTGLQDALVERGIASLAISLGLNVDNREGFYDCAVGPNTHKLYDAIDEIAAWVNWLKGVGAGRIAVLGHSVGGNQVAAYSAELLDPAVRATILLAPGSFDPAEQAATYSRRYERDLAMVLAQARGMAPEALMVEVPFIRCEKATVSAASFLSYYEPDPRGDTVATAARIGVPVLVVAGSADRVVGNLAPAYRPLAGEKLEFRMVEGADHFFLDLYMEDAADAMAAFLEKHW